MTQSETVKQLNMVQFIPFIHHGAVRNTRIRQFNLTVNDLLMILEHIYLSEFTYFRLSYTSNKKCLFHRFRLHQVGATISSHVERNINTFLCSCLNVLYLIRVVDQSSLRAPTHIVWTTRMIITPIFYMVSS